jgi:hypothetical protein
MTIENSAHFAPPLAVIIAGKRTAETARRVLFDFINNSRDWSMQDDGSAWGRLFLQHYRLPPNTKLNSVHESIVTQLEHCGVEIRNARDSYLEVHATPEAHAKLQQYFGKQLG